MSSSSDCFGEEVESARAKRLFNGSMSVRVNAAAANHRADAATSRKKPLSLRCTTLDAWSRPSQLQRIQGSRKDALKIAKRVLPPGHGRGARGK